MSDLYHIREFTYTEQRVLEAKERFDARMLKAEPMTREEKLVQWHGFLARWHSDLLAIGWRRFEKAEA